jgi:hypothetical protein
VIIGVGALVGGVPQKIIPGDPVAVWCDVCMTSSGVRIRYYILREDADPVFVVPVGLAYACAVCNPEAFDLGDDDGLPGDAGALV